MTPATERAEGREPIRVELLGGHVEIDDLDSFLETLTAVGDDHDVAVQAFDADLVVGRDHLRVAVERAARALDRDANVANDPAVEVLLYAAGRRQINRALEMGISEGESDVVVVVANLGSSEQAAETGVEQAADAVGGLLGSGSAGAEGAAARSSDLAAAERVDREAVLEFFDVSEAELDATDANLSDLVRERVALLDVEK